MFASNPRPVTLLVCCAALLTACAAVARAAERPLNLLILYTDEHHPKTLGCYGGQIVQTPHIDWLAEQGARCTSFYGTTPVCSPSRSSFVSGRFPQNTDVVTNDIPMRDDVVTFAEALKRKGYATGYAGKWHLEGPGKPQWAPPRKFGFEDNRFMFNRGHWKKFADTPDGPAVGATDAKGKPTYAVDGADDKSFSTDWLADKAIDFIDTHKDKPFCYMVSFPDPHGPNSVRAPYDTMYKDVAVPIPSTLNKPASSYMKWAPKEQGVSAASLRKIMPEYYGMVKCVDDNVGRILDTLRRDGLIDHTIVVFTSDHGDLCGEHCRLNKGVPYEGSARVAFLMYAPGVVKPGTVINQALSSCDFMPTTLTLMGHADALTGLQIDGRDASGLFTGKTPADQWDDVTFMRGTSGTTWLCVLTDRYKLVYDLKDKPWLADMEKDPDELNNVFADPAYADVVRTLTQKLIAYGQRTGDPRAAEPAIRDAMAKAAAGSGE